MGTTSYIYHTQGTKGYELMKTEFIGGEIFVHLKSKPEHRQCPCGAGPSEFREESNFRRDILGLPCGFRRQYFVLHGRVLICSQCHMRRREEVRFTTGQRRTSKRMDKFIASLCSMLPMSKVATWCGVGWDLVKERHKEALAAEFPKTDYSGVRYIGIDEFSIRKRHEYMTVVVNLETGAILHAVEGKDAASVIPFLDELKRANAPLEAVAIDMSEAYINAVESVFEGNVDIVHDRYHVVALANKAIDETRRDVQRDLPEAEKRLIKGQRFVLLRSPDNLSEEQQDSLDALVEANKPIFKGYVLKEQLRRIWQVPYIVAEMAPWPPDVIAERLLQRWIEDARNSGLKHFERLADTVEKRFDGILNYFDHRITNAQVEGTNNKIKVLKRQAYGYRDMEYFKLRLYALHEAQVWVA